MAPSFDYFFDFSCPYAYLASTQVEGLAERTGAKLNPKPVLLGGIFRAQDVPQNLAGTLSPAKAKHNMEDLARWAAEFGVPLNFPTGHPNRTVTALRCVLAVGEPFMALSHRFFAAYWRDAQDLSDEEVLRQVLRDAGHDPEVVLEEARTPKIKDELRLRTDEAIAAGLFGVPGFVVNGELYWGQDRMSQVETALTGSRGASAPGPGPKETLAPTDLWFDYSSPFAYLASTRAPSLFGDALRWRPMLLGAVFKMVDAPNVPYFAMSEAKRRWVGDDLERQAEEAGVPLRWPSGFPLRTVLPLRMTLLALEIDAKRASDFIHSVFAALWQDDRSPEDTQLMTRLADEAGFDGGSLALAASSDEAKGRLRSETNAAVEAGVFGAPGIVVHLPEGTQLFWGNDRLELAQDAARK